MLGQEAWHEVGVPQGVQLCQRCSSASIGSPAVKTVSEMNVDIFNRFSRKRILTPSETKPAVIQHHGERRKLVRPEDGAAGESFAVRE